MPKRLLWVSRHRIRPAQRQALQKFFHDDVEIVSDERPFDDAEQIARRFRDGGFDDVILVAPLTVTQKLIEFGIQPIHSEGWKQGRRYHFSGFKRVTGVTVEKEDLKKIS